MPYDPSKKMIQLDPKTRRELKHLKAEKDFKSYDEAIKYLLTEDKKIKFEPGICVHQYADWCHLPNYEYQEECHFCRNEKNCPSYKERVRDSGVKEK